MLNIKNVLAFFIQSYEIKVMAKRKVKHEISIPLFPLAI